MRKKEHTVGHLELSRPLKCLFVVAGLLRPLSTKIFKKTKMAAPMNDLWQIGEQISANSAVLGGGEPCRQTLQYWSPEKPLLDSEFR
jgi:hypothetical protein